MIMEKLVGTHINVTHKIIKYYNIHTHACAYRINVKNVRNQYVNYRPLRC